jgi:hypothetical protein
MHAITRAQVVRRRTDALPYPASMKLRIPTVLAVTLLSGGVAAAVVACEGGSSPADAPPMSDGGCALYCIPDGTDAGVCPENPLQCATPEGNCPAGCTPVG